MTHTPPETGSGTIPSAVTVKNGVVYNTISTTSVTVRTLPDGRKRLGIEVPNSDLVVLLDKEQAQHIARLLTSPQSPV